MLVPKSRLLATVAAVARAFPVFSTKTGGKSDANPHLEIQLLPVDGAVIGEKVPPTRPLPLLPSLEKEKSG